MHLCLVSSPSTRNTFVAYAEQQNLERLRSTVQQETALLANLHVHQAATVINNSPPRMFLVDTRVLVIGVLLV